MPEQDEVMRAKEENKAEILAKPNVVGVGIGFRQTAGRMSDEMAVVALVREKIPLAGLKPEAMIPERADGVWVDVIQVGELRAQQTRSDRWRPAPGGVSIGHYKITAGTLGCVVRDAGSGDRLILSNNHVLANSNDAAVGDPILQPGPIDGGDRDDDQIAVLERFCPIIFNSEPGNCSIAQLVADAANGLARVVGSSHRLESVQLNPQATNLADAAVARPIRDGDVLDEILDIGEIGGITAPALGMQVRKSGRTTGFTMGTINVLEATVTVSYGAGLQAVFEGQIVTTAMSQGGDSGSLLVAGDSLLAVGLLFAGSDQSTIHSPMQAVLDCLGVVL